MSTTSSTASTAPSRRALLHAAWATPVVLVLTTAPARAASGVGPLMTLRVTRFGTSDSLTVDTTNNGAAVAVPFRVEAITAVGNTVDVLSDSTAPAGSFTGSVVNGGQYTSYQAVATIDGEICFSNVVPLG